MRPTRLAVALLCGVGAAALAGCASGRHVRAQNAASFAQMPPGTTAVLKVTALPTGSSKSGDWIWGVVKTPVASETFATLLAQAAREHGGLDMLPPAEVHARLEQAGLEPTLDPSADQLKAFATVLGCTSYLTAEIRKMESRYYAFSCTSKVRFELSGYAADSDRPLWSVQVRRRMGGANCSQTLSVALRKVFEELSPHGSAAPEGGQ